MIQTITHVIRTILAQHQNHQTELKQQHLFFEMEGGSLFGSFSGLNFPTQCFVVRTQCSCTLIDPSNHLSVLIQIQVQDAYAQITFSTFNFIFLIIKYFCIQLLVILRWCIYIYHYIYHYICISILMFHPGLVWKRQNNLQDNNSSHIFILSLHMES